ncbi:MAG: DNA polymerase III subunit delta [Clostridiales bacterium]|nr:DNA polymerase III subunit delta [Clostridiales bacterium]
MKKLNEDIKLNTFEKVYLLYGEENFLKYSYKKRLKQAIIGEDTMNFSSFEGKDIEFSDVKGIAETMPFFAERRLILIEDSGLFASASEQWADYMKDIPEGTYFIFVESNVDKRNKLYKRVGSIGYAVEMKRQSERDIKRWILSILKQKNLLITEEAMELFLSKNGDDMEQIYSELEKLTSYCIGSDGIYPMDVEAICSETTVNRIFEMIEAVSAGNEKKALDLYYDLLALKEPSMRILFLIARQFNQLMQVKDAVTAGKRKEELATAMKLRPFIAGKLMAQARAFTKEQLRQYVELCVDSEEAVKTGKLTDKLAVELVLVKIARR